ncbi:hypothetical protein BUALT_Bualt02G0248000 [Buddleja alternifolia]|uniref:J domain-containing protein n=1 Tax=Buddleja alternifolia TaxID=168488 RepID=A0AAV6YDV2_9LAMI|nr:hypothetical protein BUALT_Bualt02G0248000 [Buddleja alternifolia]
MLLGFPLNSRPSPSQIKAAYRRKVWETHPDRFPAALEKAQAESKFKLISEAYTFLTSGESGHSLPTTASGSSYSWVVRTGVPRGHGGGGQRNIRVAAATASVPFLLIIIGAFTLGGSTAARAYRRQKEAHPSFNPFLP